MAACCAAQQSAKLAAVTAVQSEQRDRINAHADQSPLERQDFGLREMW
jgi:hypothetical protein